MIVWSSCRISVRVMRVLSCRSGKGTVLDMVSRKRGRSRISWLAEQRRITDELEWLLLEMNKLKCLHTECTTEFDALVPSLLSRAFAGDL
jgi:hypothetical protein